MEILLQVGVADRMTEYGLPWRFRNSYYRGQRVFRMEAPHDPDDRFFPMINIQQQHIEEYLLDACQNNPVIDAGKRPSSKTGSPHKRWLMEYGKQGARSPEITGEIAR
jgi:2-polyprenyl-6-methoxyphenol hydroxylase-like FAD-dependent oxidoreductase